MSTPENLPPPAGSRPMFDSLTADLIIVEGNEDTTVRPCSPAQKASNEAYRAMLANPALRFGPDAPGAPPPPAAG